MTEHLDWRLVSELRYGRAGAAFAVACALAILFLSFRTLGREPHRVRGATLFALRLLSLAGALMLFFQPALRRVRVSTVPNHIAVLLDGSQSMTVAEEGHHPTRAERAAEVIAGSHGLFEALRKDHELDFFLFGTGLEPSSEAGLTAVSRTPSDEATHLGEALVALKERYAGRDLGGVVVLSDGADNGRLAAFKADEASALVRPLAAPIHSIWVGRKGLRDVAIGRVLSDDFAFVRTALQIEAEVRVAGAKEAGWVGRTLPVVLSRDGVAISTASLVVEADGTDYPVTFSFTPDRVGKFLYRISTPVQDGEGLAENNSKSFLLKIIRDKIRVLQVAGRPSFDERFLRGLFKQDPDVDLISFFILRTPSDVENAPSDELSLIPFPTEELFRDQLRSFDLVVLQNFNYAPYDMGVYLSEIRQYVEEGGGLAMVGGDLSFDLGGYANTPIADVLPVEMSGDESPAHTVDVRPFRLQLTSEGQRHPLTALSIDIEENLARWAAMPALLGTNLVRRASPQAVVLGTHPTLKAIDGSPLPVLAVGEFKQGRSLALTSDSSWRWRFGEGDQGGALGEATARGEVYQLFWESAMRWLIHDPSLSLLRIETESASYGKTQPVKLQLRALGPDYGPARGIAATLYIEREGSPPTRIFEQQGKTDNEGVWRIEVGALPPGGYHAVARATIAGRPSEEREVFLVESAGQELEAPAARDDLLKALSAASQGRFRESGPWAMGDLPFAPNRTRSVDDHHYVELWNRLSVLFVTVLALLGEWLLRRRWGYR